MFQSVLDRNPIIDDRLQAYNAAMLWSAFCSVQVHFLAAAKATRWAAERSLSLPKHHEKWADFLSWKWNRKKCAHACSKRTIDLAFHLLYPSMVTCVQRCIFAKKNLQLILNGRKTFPPAYQLCTRISIFCIFLHCTSAVVDPSSSPRTHTHTLLKRLISARKCILNWYFQLMSASTQQPAVHLHLKIKADCEKKLFLIIFLGCLQAPHHTRFPTQRNSTTPDAYRQSALHLSIHRFKANTRLKVHLELAGQ